MSSLPRGWATTQSDALLEYVSSGSRGWSDYYSSDGAAFLRVGNLDRLAVDLDLRNLQRVALPEGVEGTRTRLRVGDLVVSITADIGMVGIVPPDLGEGYVSQHVALARPNDCVVPRFLAWFLVADNGGQRQFEDLRRGATKAGLGLDDLRKLEVRLPPLAEQRRIVAKLEDLLARSRRAKAALDAIPPLLDKLRQSVLAAAFRGDLTADWRAKNPDVEPAEKLLARIRIERRKKWEEAELAKLKAKGKAPGDDRWKAKYVEPEPVDASGLPELPEGWCWVSADEVAHDITVGHVGPMEHRYTPTGIPFLRSQNVRANRFDSTELRYIPLAFHAELSKSRLMPGDLVIVRSGAPGTACVIPEELADANCADLVVARLVRGVDPHVIAFYMNSAWARAAVQEAQVGVAQQHFNVGSMRTMRLPLMPTAEQAALRTRLLETLDAASGQLAACRALRGHFSVLDRAILAKAFRGELVPQDPNDEPAEVMLARLKAEAAAPATDSTKPRPPARWRKSTPA